MNYVIGVEKINNVYCALVLHSRCVLECLLVNVLECWSKFAGKELKSVPALLFINISLTGYSNGCFMCSNMRQVFFYLLICIQFYRRKANAHTMPLWRCLSLLGLVLWIPMLRFPHNADLVHVQSPSLCRRDVNLH